MDYAIQSKLNYALFENSEREREREPRFDLCLVEGWVPTMTVVGKALINHPIDPAMGTKNVSCRFEVK